MAPVITGFTIRAIAIANTPEELQYFTAQEASLPQLSRIIIEVPVDPNEDIASIAQQIQSACEENSIPYWPEYPNTYAMVEGDTLYIAYLGPSGEVSPSIAWMAILLGIMIFAPIIMYFAIPGFAEIVNGIIMLMVMMLMLDLMGPMLKTAPGAAVTAPREPIEQRVSRKIESIADSIARTEKAFETSKSAGVSAVSSVVSDIRGVARVIKGTPSTAMSSYEKSKAAGRLDVIDDKLGKFEEHLTPGQKENLEEERRIVDELRAMYD